MVRLFKNRAGDELNILFICPGGEYYSGIKINF